VLISLVVLMEGSFPWVGVSGAAALADPVYL
jgi:hypothetical protein